MVRRQWTAKVLLFFVGLTMNLFAEIFYRDAALLKALAFPILLFVCGVVGLALYWWA